MYDDSYEDEYLKGSPDTGCGIFVCILLALLFGVFLIGCRDSRKDESRTVQVSEKTLSKQISACAQNEGVKHWEVVLNKYGYLVKTSIVCNNGMVKEFQSKDL